MWLASKRLLLLFFFFLVVVVGGKGVEEGLRNQPRGVDFITGRDVGAGRRGVELEIQESNTGQRELSSAKFGSPL